MTGTIVSSTDPVRQIEALISELRRSIHRRSSALTTQDCGVMERIGQIGVRSSYEDYRYIRNSWGSDLAWLMETLGSLTGQMVVFLDERQTTIAYRPHGWGKPREYIVHVTATYEETGTYCVQARDREEAEQIARDLRERGVDMVVDSCSGESLCLEATEQE